MKGHIMKTISEFLAELEANIKPGTKGAPKRRELHAKLCSIHNRHANNLVMNRFKKSERKALDGNGIACGYRKHCPPCQQKRAQSLFKREQKKQSSTVYNLVLSGNKKEALAIAEKYKLFGSNNILLDGKTKNTLLNNPLDGLKLDNRESTKSYQLGHWEIVASQTVDEDRNYYSKAWHRSYGPKFTVSDRKLTFTRPWGKGKRVLEYPLKAWSGDFISRAIIDLGLAPKTKQPLSIRLNKSYDAVFVESKMGYDFYRRTLLGTPVDWVIISPLGVTYHDEKRNNLVSGLHKKIKAQSRKLKGLIDYKKCRELGFCEDGIRSFCNTFNLNIKLSYTPDEIAKVVNRDMVSAKPFLPELQTLAKAYNYQY